MFSRWCMPRQERDGVQKFSAAPKFYIIVCSGAGKPVINSAIVLYSTFQAILFSGLNKFMPILSGSDSRPRAREVVYLFNLSEAATEVVFALQCWEIKEQWRGAFSAQHSQFVKYLQANALMRD